jgi:predicted dehydrogenase
MSRVRWGVLGAASIAVRQVIPAIQASKYGTVTALASRDTARARTVAAHAGVETVCASYEELLARPDIDAVYIPLPNHLHVPWSLRAMEAGKHVLCEKPIAMDAAEASALTNATVTHPHLKVMEAFMYRFHPQWVRTKELVQDGVLGAVREVQAHFSYFNVDAANIRNVALAGGGGLLDIGCYGISLARFVYGAEPARVLAHMDYDPRFGTDRLTNAIMDFGGRSATFTCGTQMARHQRVHIIGTEGRIEIEIPFNAPNDRASRIHLQKGDDSEEIAFDVCNQYTIMCDRFADAVLRDAAVPTPLEDAVANMRVIDAVKRSAAAGAWATP